MFYGTDLTDKQAQYASYEYESDEDEDYDFEDGENKCLKGEKLSIFFSSKVSFISCRISIET